MTLLAAFSALPTLAPPPTLAALFDPASYIWDLGWILIPLGVFFFMLGMISGFRRWHVNPKHINELRANRRRLRKDRDQLLEEFGLEREDIVGMEVDDEVIEAPSSRRSKKGSKRSSSSSSGRSRRRSSSGSSSGRSRSSSKEPSAEKPGSDTKSGVVRGIRSLPPTAAEKARMQQEPSAGEPVPDEAATPRDEPASEPVPAESTTPITPATPGEARPEPSDATPRSPADFLDDPATGNTSEPPPSADQLFAYLKNKSIENYEGFGPLFIDWPKKPDDLKRVAGIGEELENKLNDIGVFMLWQIAHWSDENIRSMADELYLEGAVVAAWVDEARRMIRRGL